MEDAVSLIREKLAKAEQKVQRAERSLETAQTELGDLQTALRVMESLVGDSTPSATSTSNPHPTSERQAVIVEMLGVGREMAHSPAELFSSYEKLNQETINIDTFRTTIWRMKDKAFGEWSVRSDSGSYWKEPTDKFEEYFGEISSEENAPQDTFEDVLGADAEETSAPPPVSSWSNPQSVRAG